MSADRERTGRPGGGRAEPGAATRTRHRLLRAVQGLAGVWLLAQTVLLESGSPVVEVKDSVAGLVLVLVTVAAPFSPRLRRWEGPMCLVVGAMLIVAAAVLGFGSGVEAVARQWSQVIVGVLLVGLWSARTG